MQNNTVHIIGFDVQKPSQKDVVTPNPVGFSFDSTVHFFSDTNSFFSDN